MFKQACLGVLVAAGIGFAGCAAMKQSAGVAVKPPAFDQQAFAANPALVADNYVKDDGKKAAKGARRVFIPSFRVEFVVLEQAGAGSGMNQAIIGAALDGMNEAAYQAIADKAYDAFVAELKNKGLEVLSKEEMTAAPAFKELAAEKQDELPLKTEFGKGKGADSSGFTITYSPTGIPLYKRPGDPGVGWSGGKEMKLMPAIAKALNAGPVTAQVTVRYAKFAKTSGIFAAGSKKQASYVPVLRIQGSMSILSVALLAGGDSPYFEKMPANFRLGDDVVAGEEIVTRTSNDTDFSFGGTNWKVNKLGVDPANYEKLVLKNTGIAFSLLMIKVKENM